MEGFRPIERRDGYLPLEDLGLVGDGATAALVGRDGSVVWLCVPRFDDDPVFCSLLDRRRGGELRIGPDGVLEARQRYEPDTGVLVTELRSRTGLVRITDALTLRGGVDLAVEAGARGELVRHVVVVDGEVDLEVAIEPRGGATASPRGDGLRLRMPRRPDLDLQVVATRRLEGTHTRIPLRAGDDLHLALRWARGARAHRLGDVRGAVAQTMDSWRRWIECVRYDGPQSDLVRRSAITLKLLDHHENGSIVAAPTSSLPEGIGGVRNWDYRYAWVRDAAFSVYAFQQIGMRAEARAFLDWVLEAVERDGRPRVLYDLDGDAPPDEREDPELEGYRRSAPVRWGNGAADQQQNDAYGEIVDCAYLWAREEGAIPPRLWEHIAGCVDAAARCWDQPDHGIWEVRTDGHVFTYSAALCEVALERGARMVEEWGLDGDAAAWRAEAERIRKAIRDRAWDDEQGAFTEHLGAGGGLDASILALPLRRVLDARDPRMIATVEAVRRELGSGDGLLHRYDPERSPDGLPGEEGAFLLCSFWLVDNLTAQGRLDDAAALYESLCARANPLGLLPEQIDPSDGSFLGNVPQAFSHVGVIASGVALAEGAPGSW